MKTIIFYYTGTGNSLWTARLLADEIGNTEIHPMHLFDTINAAAGADAVGFVFPVHMWGIPNLVMRFLNAIKKDPSQYYFAAAVTAGQVSRTLIQLRNILKRSGLTLSVGIDVVLPSNYIPWGGPGPVSRQEKRFNDARGKIKEIAAVIKKKDAGPIEKGPLWQRIIFTGLYKMTFGMIPKMDRDFWVDDKCNSCEICAKVCPVENITMQSGKPAWEHRCEQCLACIQWCPQKAIQYGKKTPAYERYHHPEVKVKEMLRSSSKR